MSILFDHLLDKNSCMSVSIPKIIKPKPWTRYKTKCGFIAEIYRSTESTNHDFAMGAILIPNHPATFPGYQPEKWDPVHGKCITKNMYNDAWDLAEEIENIQPITYPGDSKTLSINEKLLQIIHTLMKHEQDAGTKGWIRNQLKSIYG